MTDIRPTPPAHLRLVAVLLVVFFALLALDYLALRLSFALPLPAIHAALGFPAAWVSAVWTAGVWLGLLAAALLFSASRASVLIFVLVAVLMAVTAASATGSDAIAGLSRPVAWAVLILVPLLGWLYARTLNRQKILR